MNHDAWIEQADVYALGALDGAELAEFEAHLATGCATCAERLPGTREALTLLPRSLPAVALPPGLRARVLAGIAAAPNRLAHPVCMSLSSVCVPGDPFRYPSTPVYDPAGARGLTAGQTRSGLPAGG